MLLFVYDYGSLFFILCCLACKIVLSHIYYDRNDYKGIL